MAFATFGLPKSMIEAKLNQTLEARKRQSAMEKGKTEKAELAVSAVTSAYGLTYAAKQFADEETGKELSFFGVPARAVAGVGGITFGIFGKGPWANRALGAGIGALCAVATDMANEHVENSEDDATP